MNTRNYGHEIQIDADYIGALLFEAVAEHEHHTPREHSRERPPHVAPRRMVPSDNPEDYPPFPPPVSGYREADVQGLACWNCGHFSCCDSDKDGVPDGICNLWETQANGPFVCDRFTPHADLFRQQPHTSWREDQQDDTRSEYDKRYDRGPSVTSVDYSDTSSMNEVNFADAGAEESEGLVWKDILRTGVWNSMPTTKGIVKKRLQIVKDGVTDIAKGVISLSELKKNFDDKAIQYVTVPLSDDQSDHKNIARVNTGFVRKLMIVDGDGDTALLRAGIDFTDPEVKERVLRQEIPDVSAGIPFNVTRRSDDKFFSSVLDHVCLTRKPFVDGLGPFGIAAADGDTQLQTEAWEQGESLTPPTSEAPPQNSESLSFRESENALRDGLNGVLIDPSQYVIEDIADSYFVIKHKTSGVTWKPTYRREGSLLIPQRVNEWTIIDEGKDEPEIELPVQAEPVAATDLHRAQELRELALSQPTSQSGGLNMSTLDLDGVELSDDARARVQAIIAENETLRRSDREARADARIAELQEIPGLKDRPGALKLYREIMLSDDGRPAAVLFSDGPESQQVGISAIEILDRFIEAVRGETGVTFSDQALASGNDKKPPLNADGERKPLGERVEESKVALYGKTGQRRTGRR
jgi:hypothetical protein